MPLYLRGIPLLLFLFRTWRRLPASQRRRVLNALRAHGPRTAALVAHQARVRAGARLRGRR